MCIRTTLRFLLVQMLTISILTGTFILVHGQEDEEQVTIVSFQALPGVRPSIDGVIEPSWDDVDQISGDLPGSGSVGELV